MKNYYYILGVERNATSEEIKKAYLKLVLKFHPDNNHNDEFFTKRFKEVDEAFEALFNKEKRKQYDLLTVKVQPTINFTENLGNGITLDMIFVEGGTFMMGNDSDVVYGDEKPIHSVTLDSFWIGKFQVTEAQWEVIMGNTPYNSGSKRRDLAVTMVSWSDAQEFIKKINQQFLPDTQRKNGKYRLLTEAEWEYAARGGNKSKGYKYSGSNNIDEVAWYRDNYNNEIHQVGQKKANELGLFDMSGNVREWCEDWFDGDYYKRSPNKNPKGAGSGSYRVIRGGSSYCHSSFCRVTTRRNFEPSPNKGSGLGFRIAFSQ